MKIAFEGEWYDLSKWAPYHPGGAKILEQFDGLDATEHFYSLHSDKAVGQLKKMKTLEAKDEVVRPDRVDTAFKELRTRLRSQGWYQRNYLHEFRLVAIIVSLMVFATVYATTHPYWSILALGFAFQQAGWYGHDMTHARNSAYTTFMSSYFAGWVPGFNRDWWSDKHNTHHVLTNSLESDPDIQNQPFLYLWAPTKALDHHFRKYQHIYFIPLYFFLYVNWRLYSILWAIKARDYRCLFLSLLPSYIYLATLPLFVSVGSVLLSGFFVAIVVTLSHESEELISEKGLGYVVTQFKTTRDILCPDFFTEWFCGGMQYQLEHHLFPTLPRYRYAELRPIVQQFAKENGLEYKQASIPQIIKMHVHTLKKNALAPAV